MLPLSFLTAGMLWRFMASRVGLNRILLHIVAADFLLFSSDHRIIYSALSVSNMPSGKLQAHVCLSVKSGSFRLVCLVAQFCEILHRRLFFWQDLLPQLESSAALSDLCLGCSVSLNNRLSRRTCSLATKQKYYTHFISKSGVSSWIGH